MLMADIMCPHKPTYYDYNSNKGNVFYDLRKYIYSVNILWVFAFLFEMISSLLYYSTVTGT